MKERIITVLKVEPHKSPEVVTLKNELRALQEAVSIGAGSTGLIEIVSLDEETIVLCNEEGKLIGLEPNRRYGHDVFCGVFYVVGQDGEGGLTSISERALGKYGSLFMQPQDIDPSEVEATLVSNIFIW